MKVYQVVDSWRYVGADPHEDHYNGTDTLGIFVSVELAEKCIRQHEPGRHWRHYIDDDNDNDIKVTDKCSDEGILISRCIEHDSNWEFEKHQLYMIEHDLIEE